jgi:hypothetical protein
MTTRLSVQPLNVSTLKSDVKLHEGFSRDQLPVGTGPDRKTVGIVARAAESGEGLASILFEPAGRTDPNGWVVDARYNPPLEGPFAAPIVSMHASVVAETPVGNEFFHMEGSVEYGLADGSSVIDKKIVITCFPVDRGMRVQCANTGRQDWFALLMYN